MAGVGDSSPASIGRRERLKGAMLSFVKSPRPPVHSLDADTLQGAFLSSIIAQSQNKGNRPLGGFWRIMNAGRDVYRSPPHLSHPAPLGPDAHRAALLATDRAAGVGAVVSDPIDAPGTVYQQIARLPGLRWGRVSPLGPIEKADQGYHRRANKPGYQVKHGPPLPRGRSPAPRPLWPAFQDQALFRLVPTGPL